MEEPYAVIPPVRICAGLLSKLSFITINYEEIYGDHLFFQLDGVSLLFLISRLGV